MNPIQSQWPLATKVANTVFRFYRQEDVEGGLACLQALPHEHLGVALHAVLAMGWSALLARALNAAESGLDFSQARTETHTVNHGYPLHTAANCPGADMLALALAHGINEGLFEPDADGDTPLMLAARNHVESVRLLLRAGADPDQVSFDGRTALFEAAQVCKEEVVSVLLDAGADPCLVDLDEVADPGMVGLLEAAQNRRAAMPVQRYRAVQVRVGEGEGLFVLPPQVSRQGLGYVADVAGDIAGHAAAVSSESSGELLESVGVPSDIVAAGRTGGLAAAFARMGMRRGNGPGSSGLR